MATETIADLRAMMYDVERGAWFSSRFELRSDGSSEASFNNTNDPAWWPAVPPEVFARDLEAFPRSPEHVPGWLADLLKDVRDFDPDMVRDTEPGR